MPPTRRSRVSLEAACATIDATCICTRVRQVSRVVTRFFDSSLAASGLRVTQFTVLVAICRSRGATFSGLANAIGMDRSTLPRNVQPLVRRGWITVQPAPDRRRRTLQLTKAGEKQLARTIPHWDRAQRRILRVVGRTKWDSLSADLLGLAESARTPSNGARSGHPGRIVRVRADRR